ncbi:Ig-like domain-containing protein [uncultured Eubacterium sp.]|uniref:Ig-like domain-containing protein n=1 Tax=uncultured Eubacterium sp. TaxID=165185 RepID=UPI0025996ED1|nr:Ig-like domain-containing protein [uncultured Eubacterium sp.]
MLRKKRFLSLKVLVLTMLLLCTGIVKENVKAEENTTIITEQTTNKALTSPSCFKGMSSKKGIVLSWKKNNEADGYIIYKNGRKLKTIKSSKTKYTDKKVKTNKAYTYEIQSYKNAGGTKTLSVKSLKIKVVKTNANSRKQNVTGFENIKKEYKLGIGESSRLKPTVKITKKSKKNKKVKNTKKVKQKAYSKKIRWSSSNPSLVKVDKNGRITAASDKTTGTAYIYAIAHNGVQKKIKVSVVNYALLGSVKNLKKVNENSIKELLTISKNDTSKIAEYFQYNNPGKSVELSFGFKPITTESGGQTYEMCIEMNNTIELEKEMYDFILKYLQENDVKTIKVEKNYVVFQNAGLYSFGYKLNDLVYVFNGKEALDNYQYNNAVYDVIPVSDRWYYGTSYAYGNIF